MTTHGSGTTLEHHWDQLYGINMNQTTLKGLSIAEQATSTDHLRKLFMVSGYMGSAWNSTDRPYRDDLWYDFSCEEGHFMLGAICEAPGVVEHIRDD